ncbi:cytochrome-c oxidase chain VI [Atractiella rhizophila]|nr:cytochrome-c oxidase chain VI [Atractiella rhizophila]
MASLLARSSFRTISLAPSLSKPITTSLLLQQKRIGLRFSSSHAEESYEAFNARYAQFFSTVTDIFELQRGLNNCFSYDLVPALEVVNEALKASRRVNDFSTAVRVFEGLKEKVENKGQYEAYLRETEGLRKELGVQTKEEMYGLPPY